MYAFWCSRALCVHLTFHFLLYVSMFLIPQTAYITLPYVCFILCDVLPLYLISLTYTSTDESEILILFLSVSQCLKVDVNVSRHTRQNLTMSTNYNPIKEI
jgi:hypothetical protein